MTELDKIFQLKLGVQTYNWGKVGLDSEVCKYLLYSGQMSPEDIEEEETYAELWVGAHSKSPNYLTNTGQDLAEFLREHQDVLGKRIVERFGPNLPFLMKVLSIGHPLQLQVHPSKAEAKLLHQKNPSAFLDEKHKPEMAVALTPFSALAGFREPSEILAFAEEIAEFAEVLGWESLELLRSEETGEEKLGQCYRTIFRTGHSRDFLSVQRRLLEREVTSLSWAEEEFRTLFESFPGDPGCFAPFLLNIYRLQPGEAIFLPAGEIHAYISGDCVEVLSCGDNVLFCGLVHQEDISHFPAELTDPDILADIVNFSPNSEARVTEELDSDNNLCLAPPVEEFKLIKIQVSEGSSQSCRALREASTMLVLEGSGKALTEGGSQTDIYPGQAFLVPANLGLRLEAEEELTVYRTCLGC